MFCVGEGVSYPTKGMYVCEDRVTRARVSVPILWYMYIYIYESIYSNNVSEYEVPFSCKIGVRGRVV